MQTFVVAGRARSRASASVATWTRGPLVTVSCSSAASAVVRSSSSSHVSNSPTRLLDVIARTTVGSRGSSAHSNPFTVHRGDVHEIQGLRAVEPQHRFVLGGGRVQLVARAEALETRAASDPRASTVCHQTPSIRSASRACSARCTTCTSWPLRASAQAASCT